MNGRNSLGYVQGHSVPLWLSHATVNIICASALLIWDTISSGFLSEITDFAPYFKI